MNHTPLVSIIVNNYNYGRFLREAINSALNQTYPKTEVIVVDDGSTDDSREVIAEYGDRITPVLKENGGQASAFNAGFATSRGEIATFLDADDYLFPHAIARVVAAWRPGIANVQCRLKLVDAVGNSIGAKPPYDTPMHSGEVWRVLLEKGYYSFPPTSGLSFGRAVLERLLPVPEAEFQVCADAYLATLVPFYGQINAIEEALGVQRIHDSNLWAHQGAEQIGQKMRRSLQHDTQKRELLIHKANELGHRVPRDLSLRDYRYLMNWMILLRLDQEHPLESSSRLSLVYWGLRAIWRYSELYWRRRLTYSAWFVWVGLLPLPVAKPVIAWLFAPDSRPAILEWTIRKSHSVLKRR